jgi:hypothetical protein
VPSKKTKGTVSVFLELPEDLMERVKDFARRDMRSIKMEFIRALHLLLDTYDRPGVGELIGSEDRTRATYQDDTTQPLGPSKLAAGSRNPLAELPQMDEETFQKVLARLKKPEEKKLAEQLHGGISLPQLFAEASRQGNNIEKPLNRVESVVRSVLRDAGRD